jgi:hypothetical protein
LAVDRGTPVTVHYYDFLDLGDGRLGLVLADVSGKGLYAALPMASLQASLRSLSSGWASQERPHLLPGLGLCDGGRGRPEH